MTPAIERVRQGGEALGEGAIRAGMRHFFGYPHAPQTDLVSYLARRLPEVSGVFVQAESVRSALAMALGASAAGARVLTSVAGSDFGLAGETLSYLVGEELPMVMAWFTRSGAGSGGLSPSQEGLIHACVAGPANIPVWAPMTVQEMHDLAATAFELADAHRHPMLLFVDSLVANVVEPIDTPAGPLTLSHLPKKPWAVSGTPHRERQILHSRVQPDGPAVAEQRLIEKVQTLAVAALRFEDVSQAADIVVVACGGAARIAHEGVRLAREAGINAAVFRPISLWPFPGDALNAAANGKPVLAVEFAHGQLATLMRANGCPEPMRSLGGVAQPPTPEAVAAALQAISGGHHG